MPIVKYGKKKEPTVTAKQTDKPKPDSKVLNKLKGMTKKKG